MKNRNFFISLKNSFFNVVVMLPMITAVVLIVGLFQTYVTKDMIISVFTRNKILDTLIGDIAGAVSIGQVIVGYILGGELLKDNVSLYAVTAFIISWITIGLIQIPAEIEVFGIKFTFIRNMLSFVFSIITSILIVVTLRIFS